MFKKFRTVSRDEMKHVSRGIFRYGNRKPVAMVKGGHGEDNIRYLKKNRLGHQINKPQEEPGSPGPYSYAWNLQGSGCGSS
ncbi:MAG: hypothetical protein LKE52_02765 [Bacilli bacterium]|jgi:hypothetical protein|nr:hypothetical protein [Bacilli bacterium]